MEILINWKDNTIRRTFEYPVFETITDFIRDRAGLEKQDYYLTNEGRVFSQRTLDKSGSTSFHLKLIFSGKGGKGGFGSLLRGQAVTKKKFDNRDASRDLNGRRIRNTNNEEKLKEFVRKQNEENKEIDVEMKKFKEIQKSLRVQQKTTYTKKENYENLEKWKSILHESISVGRKKIKGLENSTVEELEEEAMKKVKLDNPENLNLYFTSLLTDQQKIELSKKSSSDIQNNEDQNLNQNTIETDKKAKEDFFNLNHAANKTETSIDLSSYTMACELEALGPEKLKEELIRLGLKCGGTVQQRAQRLWKVNEDPLLLFSKEHKAKGT